MRILFINLASHQGTLGCVTEKTVESLRTIDHRIGDADLLPELDACLKAAGWAEKDLTHIACVTGPGGFTSLRVAVAFGNTLSHALKVPMVGIHLSDLYRARTEGKNMLWLHSAKTKEIFVRGFGTFATEWPEAVDVSVESVFPKIPSETPYIGELIETHRALAEAKSVKPAAVKPLEKILPGFLAGLAYAPRLLQPWYGREG